MLKYFNEKQFFKIVQVTSRKSNVLGKLPKALTLPLINEASHSRPASLSRVSSKAGSLSTNDTDTCPEEEEEEEEEHDNKRIEVDDCTQTSKHNNSSQEYLLFGMG